MKKLKSKPKKMASGGSILDTETQNSKRILVGPDSLGNNQFINTSIPELTPEFQHSMPDGQKYKYNDLIKAYPGMANTNVYKKTFNRLPPARPVPVFDTGGEISDNPPSMGDKYGNQQINAMKADGSIIGNGSSSFFKSKGFQQGVQGATQGLNAYNTSLNQDSVGNPYRQREEQSYQSTMGVVGQTGPIGSVIAGGAALGDAIGSPIRNRSEQTTETGQLQSRRKFINGNAAGSFFDPLRSSLSAFNDPEASTGEKIGSVLGWGAAFGKRRANRFEDRAINQRVQEENQAADTGNSDFMYRDGGEVVPTQINVEKGELLSSPEGKILKEYRNKPLHPNKGINLDGNTTEQPGHYIIPRKMAKTFAEGDKLKRNTILMNLQSQEPEGKMKKGGMVYKAEKGMRIPKMDGETDGSVIPYNQNWYPGLDMQLPVYSNERGFGQANTVGGDLPLMQSKAYTAPVYSNDLTIQPRRNSAQMTPQNASTANPTGRKDYSQPTDYSASFRPSNALNSQRGSAVPPLRDHSLKVPQNASGDNPKDPWWKDQRVGNTASTIGGALVNNFGPLAYLFGEGKKYDKVNYGSVNPELLDPREELAQAQLENNSLNASIRDASGGNTGSYLTNRIVANRQNFMNKAKTLRDYANTNAGIKNQFKWYNKTNEIRAKEAEAQNKGQAQTNYYGALSNLGRNTAGSISDAQKAKRDEQMLKLYSNIYQNYDFNPDTYEFTLKKDKTKS